jgi:hypothetical protein
MGVARVVPSAKRKVRVLSLFTVTSTTPHEPPEPPEPPEPEARVAWRAAIWFESTTKYASSVMPSTVMEAGANSVAKTASSSSRSSVPMLPFSFASGLYG